MGHTKDPKYYNYHRIMRHPTKNYFIFKDKIQALVEARVILNEEKKQVTTNMVSLQFS